MITRIKQFISLCGDLILLYGALFLTILFRYGSIQHLDAHILPFSFIFILWIILLYAFGFYEVKNMKNTIEFVVLFAIALFIGMIGAIVIFYLIPYFHISPKTNLVIFSAVFFFIGLSWRMLLNRLTKHHTYKLLLVGNSEHIQEILSFTKKNSHIGYDPIYTSSTDKEKLFELCEKYSPSYIVYDSDLFPPHSALSTLSRIITTTQATSYQTKEFYELLFKKISLSHAPQISSHSSFYATVRPLIEKLFALILFVILLPLNIIIYLLIILSSRGGGMYSQERVGKYEKTFRIYKFRTMVQDAEKQGPQYAQAHDPRITRVGKFLRFTHLDEFPQLINVLKGDISFVGPRPERPHFVTELKKEIPFYSLRHSVSPGITGWAQVQYRYGSNIEETKEKLRFDLYYIKHQSFFLDLIILTKTLKMFFFKNT